MFNDTEYRKQRRANDPEYAEAVREKDRRKVRRIKEYLNGLRASTPCADCGLQFPYYVMEFDHLHSKITSVFNLKSWKAVELEVAKCQIVCANCHNARTHHRRAELSEQPDTGRTSTTTR